MISTARWYSCNPYSPSFTSGSITASAVSATSKGMPISETALVGTPESDSCASNMSNVLASTGLSSIFFLIIHVMSILSRDLIRFWLKSVEIFKEPSNNKLIGRSVTFAGKRVAIPCFDKMLQSIIYPRLEDVMEAKQMHLIIDVQHTGIILMGESLQYNWITLRLQSRHSLFILWLGTDGPFSTALHPKPLFPNIYLTAPRFSFP